MRTETGIKGSLGLVLLFFFVTGLTGLVYELVWIRLLILVFGSTQFAVTTVLTTFMTGLALGSLIFGRFIDRHGNPLKLYGILEILIGVYCLLSPSIFDAVRAIYLGGGGGGEVTRAGFNGAQFALTFAALIIPTTLMGGTLPVIVKLLASLKERVGFSTAVAYSVNTVGAVTGCLFAGLFSLYIMGVKTSVYAAGAVDIVIGVILVALYSKAHAGGPMVGDLETESDVYEETGGAEKESGTSMAARPFVATLVLSAFALSGFISLAYEVLWTRVLSLVIGSSVYAFTVMLATFLLGIGLGSIIFAPFIDRSKQKLLWFALLEAIIGIASLTSIALYPKLPLLFHSFYQSYGEHFYLFLFIEFLICAILMIVPTLCMGAIFPLVAKLCTASARSVGRHVGDVYFFNTAGAIFGSFIAGFIMIPYIGAQNSVMLLAAANAVIAVVLLWASSLPINLKGIAMVAVAVLFAGVSLLVPKWDRMGMTLGLYSNVYSDNTLAGFGEGSYPDELVYYREGINAVITVREEGPILSYQANGKVEARSIKGRPAETWSLLGHIPMLIDGGRAENALLVGLGSGITLGAMESYPLREIDVVELEPAVAEAAEYFYESNNDALSDKRAKLHITDGRNFVFTTEKKYGVIVSAVSDPWITGVSNLFTIEYFHALRERLKDGGTVALWFQNYRIRPEELKIGLKTFAEVFSHVSVWFHYTNASDLVVIGSMDPHWLDYKRLRERFKHPKVRLDLRRIGITDTFGIFDLFLVGDKDLRSYLGEAPVNTDERPLLEFSLPKLQYMDPGESVKLVGELLDHAGDPVAPHKLPGEWGAEETKDFYYSLALKYNRSAFRLDQALSLFRTVRDIDPAHAGAKYYIRKLEAELGIDSEREPRKE